LVESSGERLLVSAEGLLVISFAIAFQAWPTASLFQERKKHQQCIELKSPVG
jgi:hypothetical protein